MNFKIIETERLILKPISKDDSVRVYNIYSNKEVCKFLDIYAYKNLSQAEDQISRWINLAKEGLQYRFSINYNNIIVGTCGIYSIYNHQNRASLGYDLDPKYWNKGIITEALRSLLKFIDKELKIHRIQATVLPGHLASKKVLEKLNFVFEGTLQDYEKWKGEYVDLEMYSRML